MTRWIVSLLMITVLGGCSFMGLTDITIRRCETDEECEVFNEVHGIDPNCRAYYCSLSGRCVRHEEGAETCDGRDNDCDGLIDEPSTNGTQTIAPPGSGVIDSLGTPDRLTYAVDPSGAAAAVWADTDSNTASFATFSSGAGVEGSQMGYMRGELEPDLRQLALTEGCPRILADGSVGAGDCNFAEVAVDLASDDVFVAAVNAMGCNAGRLMLGYFARGDDPNVVLRGPARRSNSYLGVDLHEDGACSGGSRPDCTGATSGCGVSRPAVAALNRIPVPQALVAWLGDAADRGECGGSEVNVEMVAAFLVTEEFGEPFSWVTASNENLPQVLGTTTGGGRPAIASYEDAGYLVGYGDADGNLALHAVGAAQDPPEYDGYSCDAGDCDGPEDRTGLETVPISGIINYDAIEAAFGGSVNDVAIAMGASRGDALDVGVAWREGCGGGEVIGFRRLVITMSGGVPGAEIEVGQAVRMSADSGSHGPPTVMYASDGFVVEGFERGGAGPATEGTDGGWYVAWATGGQAVARRIAELDGLALDETELIDLTQTDIGHSADAALPRLYRSEGGSVHYAYHDRDNEMIVGGELTCREAPVED